MSRTSGCLLFSGLCIVFVFTVVLFSHYIRLLVSGLQYSPPVPFCGCSHHFYLSMGSVLCLFHVRLNFLFSLPGLECQERNRKALKCYMLNPRWLWLLNRGWLKHSWLTDPTRLHRPRDQTWARGGGADAQDPWAWLPGAHLGSSHNRG